MGGWRLKVGILSDTHLPKKGERLPLPLLRGLDSVDAIVHAGDWSTLAPYAELQAIAPVHGVCGNIESEEAKAHFPSRLLLALGGYRIGVVHGHEGKGRTTPERAFAAFADEWPDVIVFGHSHIPYAEKREGVYLFNPGSPTDKRRQPQFSYGLLMLGETLSLQHCYFA